MSLHHDSLRLGHPRAVEATGAGGVPSRGVDIQRGCDAGQALEVHPSMIRAKRICGARGCSELAAESLCPQHQIERAQRGYGRSRRLSPGARGYGAEWRLTRASVLRRQPMCGYCGERPSSTVDHAVPKHLGGSDHPSNLVGCCARCHLSKSGREGAAAKHASRKGRAVSD